MSELDKPASVCPQCGSDLDDSPAGSKVYKCPAHGELIINVLTLEA